MSKEIEETREQRRKQRMTEDYMNVLGQQLRDRGFFYTMAIFDPSVGAVIHGHHGSSGVLAACVTETVKAVSFGMNEQICTLAKRLKEQDPTWEN